jgi:rhamnosyl/mannosyltransferase
LLQAAQGFSGKIVIAGAGPLAAELKTQAATLQLENIIFLGHVSDEDKVALLTLSLGVVFPSHLRSEAFGVSLLEGAMYGKPLISTDIGTGTSYINVNQETGLVVPPEDATAFRQAMQWLLDHPQAAEQMGVQAEKRYEAYFTAKKMGESYSQLYSDLISGDI